MWPTYTIGKEMGTVATRWSGACTGIWARYGIEAWPWSFAWSSTALLYGCAGMAGL